jgi:DNA-binding transcriptional ArsR family regulator
MVEYLQLDATYDAIANPVRRRILAELTAGEKRVTEVAAPFELSLAAVSKHIRQLERAGLVQRRIAGRDHWLRLDPTPLGPAEAWIAQARRFWTSRLDALAELVEAAGFEATSHAGAPSDAIEASGR